MGGSFEQLIEVFLKLPGIGPRQARRFAHFVVRQSKETVNTFAKSLIDAKDTVRQCSKCFRYTNGNAGSVCGRCSDASRDRTLLIVTLHDDDTDAIERSGQYNGHYFVLGGALPLRPDKSKHIAVKIEKLAKRVKKDGSLSEIILATSATPEGDYTAREIEKALDASNIKITRLARGLSTGSELEYIDEDTLSHALKNRA